ncbi:MAG: extracellular solute-binding protein [Anaerolineae bacterium]|nr:extracellular solute-binding protein [Anaerolineae bacterium]
MSRITLMLVLVLCTALLLAACGGGDSSDSSETSNASDPTPAAAVPKTPQTFVIWHPFADARRDALETIRRDFEIAQPRIDIQIEFHPPDTLRADFEAAVYAGAGPDLLFGQTDWIPPLASQGLIQPIGYTLFENYTNIVTESIAYSTLVDGIPYATVYSAEFVTLYYNRTLLDPAPNTYDDLLLEGGALGLLIPPTFAATSGLYLSPGRQLMDEQGHSQIVEFGLETYLRSLQDMDRWRNIRFTFENIEFLEGRAAMLIASSTDYLTLYNALGDNLGVASFPLVGNDRWSTLLTVQPVMQNLNSTAAALNASHLFIMFLNQAKTQREWFIATGQTPVNPALLDNSTLSAAWGDSIEFGTAAPLLDTFNSAMRPVLDQAVQAVVLHDIDPAQAASSAYAALQSMSN